VIYTDVQPLLKTGNLAFFHNPDPIAKLVQWKTKSLWDHIGIVVVFGGRRWLVESSPTKGGPRMVLLSEKIPDMFLLREGGLSEAAIDFAFAQFNKDYSYFDAIRAGLGRRTNNSGFICSEYVSDILKVDGASIGEWGQTPQALFDFYKGAEQILVT
jgi:hypothetical protein